MENLIIYPEESYRIQGAVFEVYREMGCGFLEAVYTAQAELELFYKGEALRQSYKPDFICYDMIIVELKAMKAVAPEHEAQVFNYLKATGMRLGLLVNFGSYPKATIKRLAS